MLCRSLFFKIFWRDFHAVWGRCDISLWDFLLLAACFFFWDVLVRVHAFCYIIFFWDLLARFHAFWPLLDVLVRFHVFCRYKTRFYAFWTLRDSMRFSYEILWFLKSLLDFLVTYFAVCCIICLMRYPCEIFFWDLCFLLHNFLVRFA